VAGWNKRLSLPPFFRALAARIWRMDGKQDGPDKIGFSCLGCVLLLLAGLPVVIVVGYSALLAICGTR
jgi:hypothetical protein